MIGCTWPTEGMLERENAPFSRRSCVTHSTLSDDGILEDFVAEWTLKGDRGLWIHIDGTFIHSTDNQGSKRSITE